MINSKKAMGAAMAVAAAGMLSATAPVFAAERAADEKVHCYGVNKCKGHNDCKTANNACKGHASCKGQGFVAVSAKACDHLGGKVGK
jgi:uncharacterized membrane protein